MPWTTHLSRGCAALCLSLTAATAQASLYSNMYVFGDSLSDSGNDLNITSHAAPPLPAVGVPAPAYYTDGTHTGRFTNGLNYADRLAADFGLALTPSTMGGNSYAYGGARSDYVLSGLDAYGALSFNQQLGQYLSNVGNVVDPDALYVLWIGSNDMSDAIGKSLQKGGDLAPIQSEIAQTITDIVTAFVTLEKLGARNFVIGNVPDLSLTPTVRQLASAFGPGVQTLARGASAGFNAALAATLPVYTFATSYVTLFDAFDLQTEMTNNPSAYGLTNVTAACYTGEVDGTSAAGQPTVCAKPDEYLYYDFEHPSAALHARAANMIYTQLVPEPGQWALTLIALGLLGSMSRRRSRR